MFAKQKTEDSDLQELEAIIRAKLHDDSVGPDEFAKILDKYAQLVVAKTASKRDRHISPDTLATIGANLAGIVLILNYERAGVVASKALGFVQKLR